MIKSIASLFLSNRIQSASCPGLKHISTQTFPLQFKASPALWAEPLKKKRKIDPAIIRAREERKKKKLMKEIRQLQRQEKVLKPIADFETPVLAEEMGRRTRQISVPVDVSEERTLLFKHWARIKLREARSDNVILNRLKKSQKTALDELRLESEELYQAAVRIDENLIPLKYKGPTETPSKQDYPIPDGAYIDISRKWGDCHVFCNKIKTHPPVTGSPFAFPSLRLTF